MLTKAAIIGTNLFPPLILYWYQQFKDIWYDEVDRVYLAISQPVHPSVSETLVNHLTADPKIKIKFTGKPWPDSITHTLKGLNEDLFFIPHDDTFILSPGAMTRYFDVAAHGKVVTPMHNHYHPPYLIDELMMAKWPNQLPFRDPATGSTGFSFFCNFFFISRQNYLKTSGNMNSIKIEPGQNLELLNFSPRLHTVHSDVQFLFGLELLNAGIEFEIIKKNELPNLFLEGNPLDALKRHFENHTGPYADEWIHLQSIGFNLTGMFFDPIERERIQAGRKETLLPLYTNYPIKPDAFTVYTYLMRAALMKLWLCIKEPVTLKYYYEYMRGETDGMINYFGLNREMVAEFTELFKNLFYREAYAKRSNPQT